MHYSFYHHRWMFGESVVVHDISALLTGTGSLTASVTLDIPIVAALSGTGSLTAAVTVDVIVAATLTGIGTLTSDVSVDVITSATLTGTGTATASVLLDIPVGSTLSGTGSATGDVSVDVSAAATLTGTGTLSSSVSIDIITGAVLSGTGTATAGVNLEISTSAALTGSGALTSNVILDISTTATISGTGTATGSVTTQPEIHADMPGNGSLTATVTVISGARPTPGSYRPRVTDYPKLPKYDRVRRRVVKVHAVLANLKLRLTLQARVTTLIHIAASLVAKSALRAKVSVESTIYAVKFTVKNTHNVSIKVIHNITSTLSARTHAVATVFINTLPDSRLTARIKATASVEIDTENADLMLLFDDIAEFLHETDESLLVSSR